MDVFEPDRAQITIMAISYLGLKTKRQVYPSTKEVMCQCPFHKDVKPSMGIDVSRGIYNCFSCGSRGTIEQLFRQLTGDSLYKVLGIPNDPFQSFARQAVSPYASAVSRKPIRKSVYVNMDPADFIPVSESPLAMRYLLRRGVDPTVAEAMDFMYTAKARVNTTAFVNRVCIPLYDKGVLCSMEGRKILSADPGPKVLYPKNTSVDMLYGFSDLDTSARLYACEGLMDLALLRACPEFRNSTSIFGAKVTARQLEQLSMFEEIVYINDLDEAGFSTLDELKASGLRNVYRLPLPENLNGVRVKDIGDLPKAHSSVRELLDKKWLSRIEPL